MRSGRTLLGLSLLALALGAASALSTTAGAAPAGRRIRRPWVTRRCVGPKRVCPSPDGATHAANEIGVASGQVDCATDFDRNRNAMIEGGKLEKNATEVVWISEPLPNDAIAVPRDFDPALADRIQKLDRKSVV